MRLAEAFTGKGGRGIKDNGGGGELSKYSVRTFVNVTMYPNPAQQ
jgi:hypothetical protein